MQFPPEVIDYIAENVNESVRDLEGIVIAIMARSTIFNKEIDLDLAQHIVAVLSVMRPKVSVLTTLSILFANILALRPTPFIPNQEKRSGTSTSSSDVFGKDIHRFLYFENWEIYWKQRSCHRTPRMQNRKRAMRSR